MIKVRVNFLSTAGIDFLSTAGITGNWESCVSRSIVCAFPSILHGTGLLQAAATVFFLSACSDPLPYSGGDPHSL